MGLAKEKNYSKYHRVLSHARWDGLVLSKILLGLLIALLPPVMANFTGLTQNSEVEADLVFNEGV
jgi:hypothetical protein